MSSTSASSTHDDYLARRPFTPECSTKIFSPQERQLLRRYGHWLQALAEGTIEPESEDQEQFVRLVHGDTRPDAARGRGAQFADLWWRYQKRLAWERKKE